MSQLPISDDTMLGYEAPRNVQFSVFLDNRVGKLHELVQVFAGQALRLAGLSIADSADYAVIRLLTSNSDLARRLLTRHGFAFSESDVLVIELESDDTIGRLCQAMISAELNIHYAYPLMVRPRGRAALAFNCDDRTLASQILLRKRFTLLAENDLGDNATPGDIHGMSN